MTCEYDSATDTASVTVTNGTPFVRLIRGGVGGDEVLIDTDSSTGGESGCANGPATVANTDTIAVDEQGSGQATTLLVDLRTGRFEPGATTEGAGTSEIEIAFAADSTGTDTVSVNGSNEGADQEFRLGAVSGPAIGAGLNGDADVDDVGATGVEQVILEPGSGDDTITADGAGSPSFTGSLPGSFRVFESGGDDVIVAGAGPASIHGGADDDTITGGPANDSAHIELGDDSFDGGGGTGDFVSYENFSTPEGVVLDLAETGPQDTGGAGTDTVANVEHVVGSNGPDRLSGTDGPNTIFGGNGANDAGDDVLIGRGGADTLNARAGDDLLIGGEDDDVLRGEPGSDTVSYATGSTGPVTLGLGLDQTGVAQPTGGAGSDTLADSSLDVDADHDVENLTGSPFAGDALTGNGLANVIRAHGDGLGDDVDCAGAADGDLAVLDEALVETAITSCETVDTAAQTTVVGGPGNGAPIRDVTPTYDLDADEPADFEIGIDGGAFAPCADPCTVPALGEGEHTLRFRARDLDGNDNPDASPATRTVTIDTTAPSLTLLATPDELAPDPTPTWTFAAAGDPVAVECRLDGGPFGPCSGPGSHTAQVAEGEHEFALRATDAAGNSATLTDGFAVDTVAPETALTRKPKRKVTKRKVRFAFSAPGAAAYECRLDRAQFAPCGSPLQTKRLKLGRHTFSVRATDAAGNVEATPATHTFKIKRKRPRR